MNYHLNKSQGVDMYLEALLALQGKFTNHQVNRCDTCDFEFPTCKPDIIIFGIDINPEAKGIDSDRVLLCSGYVKRGNHETTRGNG